MSNRLLDQKSPYLIGHAENPVDWYPWGEEAISLARELGKPVFLSIGYASCHWCHVMEEECFRDNEVARLLNLHFISIKVDREERPDIDRIYMNFCQLMTGTGGWPLSLFLTPDLKPYYAATFIPRRSMHGRPGMLDLIPYLAGIWENRREEVMEAGEKVMDALRMDIQASENSKENTGIKEEVIHEAFQAVRSLYDPRYGGFGRSPKFPSIPQLLFLITYASVFASDDAHRMATVTLLAMARGGIRDHIGYGFHRYAVDQAWQIPHFEKMLYDQAMNAVAYVRIWTRTRDPVMKETASDCYRYMIETLGDQRGGFFCAEDADSPQGEGVFYLWRTDELREILTPDEWVSACRIWELSDDGNVPAGYGIADGSNIIRKSWPMPGTEGWERETTVSEENVEEIRRKLFLARNVRQRPRMDDKILTDWNGCAIGSLAYGGLFLGDESLIRRAEQAASFILSVMLMPDGTLYHSWRRGETGVEGTAQDYIFLGSGLVTLFQATGNPKYLLIAKNLAETALSRFHDHERGGFFVTRENDPLVPVRLRDDHDGPVPSVNGHAYQFLSRIALITGQTIFREMADQVQAGMSRTCHINPLATLSFLEAIMETGSEIRAVITGDAQDPRRKELVKAITSRDIPGLVIVPVVPGSGENWDGIIPEIQEVREMEPAVRICAGGLCRPPVSDPDQLMDLIDALTHSSGLPGSEHR